MHAPKFAFGIWAPPNSHFQTLQNDGESPQNGGESPQNRGKSPQNRGKSPQKNAVNSRNTAVDLRKGAGIWNSSAADGSTGGSDANKAVPWYVPRNFLLHCTKHRNGRPSEETTYSQQEPGGVDTGIRVAHTAEDVS